MLARVEAFFVVRGVRFKIERILTILIFCFSFLEAKNPSKTTKNEVAPYLLPSDHEIKPILDAIFSYSRATLNQSTLRQAGFAKASPRKFTKLIVTSHPALPGYIFKLYLDAQRPHKDLPEHHFWIQRIQGARKISHEIKNQSLENIFKTPQKWIYELPKYPKPPVGYYTKYYVLVEEDMFILPSSENKALWVSDYVKPEFLMQLYTILKKIGLQDSAKPDNIPFSYDGRIAFIDTQTHGSKKVRYNKLTPYLSKYNQIYWKIITSKNS